MNGLTGREALESLGRCYDALAESSSNYDQRQAFLYAAGEARRKIEELMGDDGEPIGIEKVTLGVKKTG